MSLKGSKVKVNIVNMELLSRLAHIQQEKWYLRRRCAAMVTIGVRGQDLCRDQMSRLLQGQISRSLQGQMSMSQQGS